MLNPLHKIILILIQQQQLILIKTEIMFHIILLTQLHIQSPPRLPITTMELDLLIQSEMETQSLEHMLTQYQSKVNQLKESPLPQFHFNQKPE